MYIVQFISVQFIEIDRLLITQEKMKLRGSLFVIICCFLLQFLNWAQNGVQLAFGIFLTISLSHAFNA